MWRERPRAAETARAAHPAMNSPTGRMISAAASRGTNCTLQAQATVARAPSFSGVSVRSMRGAPSCVLGENPRRPDRATHAALPSGSRAACKKPPGRRRSGVQGDAPSTRAPAPPGAVGIAPLRNGDGTPEGWALHVRRRRAVRHVPQGIAQRGELAYLPQALGLAGYLVSIAVLTPGYQLFQSANNTALTAGIAADRRGAVSGLLTLSRNLGLLLGASAVGAVFSLGPGEAGVAGAAPGSIAAAMRLTFLAAGSLMVLALWIVRRGAGNAAHSP